MTTIRKVWRNIFYIFCGSVTFTFALLLTQQAFGESPTASLVAGAALAFIGLIIGKMGKGISGHPHWYLWVFAAILVGDAIPLPVIEYSIYFLATVLLMGLIFDEVFTGRADGAEF